MRNVEFIHVRDASHTPSRDSAVERTVATLSSEWTAALRRQYGESAAALGQSCVGATATSRRHHSDATATPTAAKPYKTNATKQRQARRANPMVTVAILAQGTSWADADSQAFFMHEFNPQRAPQKHTPDTFIDVFTCLHAITYTHINTYTPTHLLTSYVTLTDLST